MNEGIKFLINRNGKGSDNAVDPHLAEGKMGTVYVDGEFLGTAGGCGRLLAGGAVQTFLIEKTMGLSETQISKLCEGLETMPQEEAEKMAVYIEKRINQIVNDYLK